MTVLPEWLTHLLKDSSGQDVVEYALILAFVSLAAVACMNGLSDSLAQIPNAILNQFYYLAYS